MKSSARSSRCAAVGATALTTLAVAAHSETRNFVLPQHVASSASSTTIAHEVGAANLARNVDSTQAAPNATVAASLAGASIALALGSRRDSARRHKSSAVRTRVATLDQETAVASPKKAASAAGKSAIVVGGGVAGLATATELAQAGMSVTLYEKNDACGGRCQSLESSKVKGYRWDTGPSLLLLPQKYADAFSRMGTTMKEELNLKRVDPPYRVVFGDDTHIDVDYDPISMTEQMEKFEPGCTSNYYRFLSVARRMLDMGVEQFVDRQFETYPELVDPISLLPKMIENGWYSIPLFNMLFGMDDLMKSWFQDERLRSLFTFQTLYVGLTPYNAPGALCLLAATDLTDGVWYPEGGWRGITDSLVGLANKSGVNIVTNAGVDEVVVEGGRATGIKMADGETKSADVVVVNADLPTAYRTLLRNAPAPAAKDSGPSAEATSKDLQTREYSCGVIAFYWALDTTVPYLSHHSIFLGAGVSEKETAESWKPITSAAGIKDKPNFYVHCPKRTDPSAAPEGGESVMVLFPVANMQEMAKAGFARPAEKGKYYEEIKVAARKTILRRFEEVGCGKLEDHIVEEFVRDPEIVEELYGLEYGATFALSHGLLPWQGGLAMTRPPPRAEECDGLFFVGAGTRPGNGVPLVLMGAGLTSKLILDDMGVSPGTASSSTSAARAGFSVKN